MVRLALEFRHSWRLIMLLATTLQCINLKLLWLRTILLYETREYTFKQMFVHSSTHWNEFCTWKMKRWQVNVSIKLVENLWLVANFKRIFYHQHIHVFYNRQLWCLWSSLWFCHRIIVLFLHWIQNVSLYFYVSNFIFFEFFYLYIMRKESVLVVVCEFVSRLYTFDLPCIQPFIILPFLGNMLKLMGACTFYSVLKLVRLC